MSTALRITLDEYDSMVAAGAFESLGNRRLELVRGELCEMNPAGPQHEALVDRLVEWSAPLVMQKQIALRVQNSLAFPGQASALQPDIAWVKRKDFSQRRPTPTDVLLVIEVADSSLLFDLGEKQSLYAAAGVEEYWVVDIPGRRIHILRESSGGAFQVRQIAAAGDRTSPLSAELVLPVDELFGLAD